MEQVVANKGLGGYVMTPVESSNLAEVGYDADRMELHVLFKGGARYVYFEVPGEVYTGLMAAESKGIYLNTHVKSKRPDGSGRFRFRRDA
jgi:hypothetical protein